MSAATLAKRLAWVTTAITVAWLAPLKARTQQDYTSADVARFAALARTSAKSVITETASQPLADEMDLLIGVSARILRRSPSLSEDQLMKRLAPFAKRLDSEMTGTTASEPGWFDVRTASRDGIRAIAVTMGAVSRLAVLNDSTGTAFEAGAPLRWLYRYHPHLQFCADGSLLMVSESVQDAGVRTGLRIDLVRRSGTLFAVRDTLKRTFVLDRDWPVRLNNVGDLMTVTSVDEPVAIVTARVDTHFGRSETFAIDARGFRLVRTRASDLELRAIDAWIGGAKRARTPSALQALVRRKVEGSPLSDCVVRPAAGRRTQALVSFDEVRFKFLLARDANGFRVIGVEQARDARTR